MFDETGVPRVFAVPPGADFPQALVDGLLRRQRGRPHESMARVHIVVNTRRMERRIKSLLSATGALLLPRITLINDLDVLPGARPVAPPVSALQRRLELARLIRQLLDQHPDLASADSAFDLADSLAGLIDEMHGEGVEPGDIASLDISDLSGHWARAQQFIAIADIYIRTIEIGPDAEARQRQIATDLIKTWSSNPPSDPILIAGSTGSRGTTSMLMQAVAHLPQGAVILPGFDFDAPPHMWDQLTDALSGEDHPQFRFARLMQSLNIGCNAVLRWCESAVPPAPERSSLVSLALRPAPFTDAWLSEGADQGGIAAATEEMALIEANTPRDEALAIALRLRQAAEDGQNAALITPDRMLTRQVAAALDRWNIVPDDSAGIPLHLSPPGRFLRHVSDLFVVRLRSDAMLTLLKHPLAHSGGNRGDHLRLSRDLELFLRRRGIPYPERDSLVAFQDKSGADPNWIAWLDQWFLNQQLPGPAPLSVWVERLVETAEAISAGADRTGSGELWNQNAGRSATTVVSALREASDAGGPLSAREFSTLLSHILTQDVVRDRDAADGSIMIWGTLEARVQGASLVILGGLNEGSWPEAPAPDPWLNRALRQQAGLLLPDRRIGLSAHDFQQAVNAPEVLLTRSKRSDDAETVPSRWVNRLTNLLAGLTEQGGEDALAAMRERGALWLRRAAALDDADRVTPAIRPSPRPPVAARPRQLSVTEIKRLIRDPYAIYARHVLRLRPLDPLVKTPDALVRGIVIHDILETFLRGTLDGTFPLTSNAFLEVARDQLDKSVIWPVARSLWLARLDQVATWFITHEQARRLRSHTLDFEARMSAQIRDPEFVLTAKADRIDRDEIDKYRVYDYKTGTPPSKTEQRYFDKQLLLEAAILARAGFGDHLPGPVADAVFIGLGRSPVETPAPLVDEPPDAVWAEFTDLIRAYFDPNQGFTARRAVQKETDAGDYDHLSRFGEWDRSTPATPETLT